METSEMISKREIISRLFLLKSKMRFEKEYLVKNTHTNTCDYYIWKKRDIDKLIIEINDKNSNVYEIMQVANKLWKQLDND